MTDSDIVVAVAVRVNHRYNRLARPVRVVKVEGFAGGRNGEEGIDYDEAGGALHDGHVGDREATDLINAIGYSEQAMNGIELGLTPETRVDGGRRVLLLQEPVKIGVGRVGSRGDESPVGILEVLAVAEWQLRQNGAVGGGHGWFGGHWLLGVGRI
jgi:hypothetical protein